MTNPTIYSGSERILKAGVFCTLLDLTLTLLHFRSIRIATDLNKKGTRPNFMVTRSCAIIQLLDKLEFVSLYARLNAP